MRLLAAIALVVAAAALACGPHFYPAPPSLDRYPERLPVKTMRELLQETHPPAEDAPTFEDLTAETLALGAEIGKTPADQLQPRIETLLVQNRAGDYRKRISNCLFDFRDLLAGNPPAGEAAAYADWRAKRMEFDDGFITAEPQPSYRYGEEELKTAREEWRAAFDTGAKEIAAAVAKAAPALEPHWLVQAGAWQFKNGAFDEAAEFFQQVIEQAPQHPRAEVARLMLARAHSEKWRAARAEAEDEEDEEVVKHYRAADEAFKAYLEAHPQGRFAPDVPGWRAGLALENGKLGEAIKLYLEQMDIKGHPEVVRRAVRELEKCLQKLDPDAIDEAFPSGEVYVSPDSFSFEDLARRPIAALAVVYHFLDSQSRKDFEGLLQYTERYTDHDVTDRFLAPMLRLRRAGRTILPQLAAAVAKQKDLYGAEAWRPKYLAILGWAASECGEHKHALRLYERAGADVEKSDDLLFLRAVALQRDGDLARSLADFRRFRELFPESPLGREAHFRMATLLRDQHEAGLAVVELKRMYKEESENRIAVGGDEAPVDPSAAEEPAPAPSLHLESELQQWIDTLLQFAPLAELQRGFATPELEEDWREEFQTILRRRHLAREEFKAAQRYAAPPTDAPEPEDRSKGGPFEPVAEAWQETTKQLAKLKQEAAAAKTKAAQAEKLFQVAELWAANRGQLTLLSTNDNYGVFNGDFEEVWQFRERNARVYGLPVAAIARELEQRDELQHAFPLYLQAADLVPGTDLAARCLWRANDALRRFAELSPWCARRAFETDAGALSRKLHERLLRECPNSHEAKRLSVWWTFPAPAELRWLPGSETDFEAETAIADVLQDFRGPTWESPQNKDDSPDFGRRLNVAFGQAAAWETPKLLGELTALRRDVQAAKVNAELSWLINHLDDLISFLEQNPAVAPTARLKYFHARLRAHAPFLDDPEMQPWRDRLTFLALVHEKSERPMSERIQQFLQEFPQSPKREAAMARLAIATVRESHGHTRAGYSEWPDAPRLSGYMAMVRNDPETYDPARVFGALDAYEREFPNGRWSAEIRLWRGVASIDAADWRRAVDLLVATLDDATQRDLHLDAALNLADVFMRLLEEPENRRDIIAAIAANASAQKRLRLFMHSETMGARLCCLEEYLEEQFAKSPR